MANEPCEQLAVQSEKELLENILPFWSLQAADQERDSFWARVSADLGIRERSPQGVILNTRLLWTFSAAYRQFKNPTHLDLVHRAYRRISCAFTDPIYGGVYWMLDENDTPLDESKKIYGQAFAIYGLVEYFSATDHSEALQRAQAIYRLIEKHNYDPTYTGYLESANRDWSAAQDLRLSAIDMNEKKSMNTHLHLLEAYTQLYRVWPDQSLRGQLQKLINNFIDHIINPETHHLILFFDEAWQPKSNKISFGHDIETSWLLQEAAVVLADPTTISRCKNLSQAMAEAVLEQGFAADGGMAYEKDEKGVLDSEVHWWVQAEAVVGLINAYQNSGRSEFLHAAIHAWDFIEKYLIDRTFGEWFYKVNESRISDTVLHKISEWKCPYHNSRMCLELRQRLRLTPATSHDGGEQHAA